MSEEAVVTPQEVEAMMTGVPDPLLPSWLSVWTPEASVETGYKMLIYGESGTGKTWFAASAPSPLFLDLDLGMRSVVHRRPMRYPSDPKKKVTKFSEVATFYTRVKDALSKPNCPFATIVIDGINELQDLVLAHVVEDYRANRQYDDSPTLGDFGKALRDFTKILRLFQALPCNVIFTCAALPKATPEEQLSPVLIGKKTLVPVIKMMDMIGYCYTVFGENTKNVLYRINFQNTPDHLGKSRIALPELDFTNSFYSIFPQE